MTPFDEIHAFWFEGITDETVIRKNDNPFRKWFLTSKSFDKDVKARFEAYLLNGGISPDMPKSPRERLAVIVLYDQLSRNIYRDTPMAYRFDEQACALSNRMIAEGQDLELMNIERLFVYMPFMHAENQAMQELSVRCFTALAENVKRQQPGNHAYYEGNLKYARRYQQIIEAYNRFPHRDKILGRNQEQN
ncbi:MAG: DUF924 family protein [Candidatus Omnitrophota bacterium]